MTEEKLQSKIRKIYEKACPDAARLIVSLMFDENIKPEIRLGCAEKVLLRAFPNAAENNDSGTLNVIMSKEASEYAG